MKLTSPLTRSLREHTLDKLEKFKLILSERKLTKEEEKEYLECFVTLRMIDASEYVGKGLSTHEIDKRYPRLNSFYD